MNKLALRYFIVAVAGLAAAFVPLSARAAAGDLFEADFGSGSIFKFTPTGTKLPFASALNGPFDLAFDTSGNLFESDSASGKILKFTPDGTVTTFAMGLNTPTGLAFDMAGNLFVGETG